MSISRREMITFGALSGGALLIPLERSVQAAGQSRMAESALPAPFTVPFSLPPKAVPVKSVGTTDYYSMVMREEAAEILPGYQTRIWGYNGSFPGPTVDVQQGRPVVVRQINRLPQAHPTLGYTPFTSVHLHGSASLPQYDGYASDVTYPGQYKDYRWPNVQDARTLWYHDHGVHHTASNVYMGLVGMYRMHDALEASLPIPKGYYDVPLIINDAMFDDQGQLLYDDHSQSGVFGDVILVNGRPWPVMKVERRKYRFRILNASISRTYRWSLDTGDPLVVIGTDAGLTAKPQPVKSLLHGNAERYEVVIDFAKYKVGRRVTLRNTSPKNNIDYTNTNKVMAFDVVAKASSTSNNSMPKTLYADCPTMALTPAEATATRTLALVRQGGQWTINGETWADVEASAYRRVMANPGLGDVEVWELHNDSGGWHHPIHIHLIDFRILDREFDRNGIRVAPHPHELGPKDVVYVGENERVRLIMKFTPQIGKYMVHCHNLVHEDHDMMVQYEVGAGGDDPISSARALSLPAPEL
jgi:FtsP/CotA-like multicopper oxidase with cupredoxin domain